jgi:hypothetical protein
MKQNQNNFEDLWITLQQNVYPIMIDCLAEELGVTVESIKKLGVGFYPLKQAWVFAERDENGQVIGLMQRYKIRGETRKVCWEGSKRGLNYECVGTKEKGKYTEQNQFVRVADAKIKCPICGKTDWCMVSDDNLENPKAVICPRTAKGATKSIEGAGYLHHRKNANRTPEQRILSPLPISSNPVLVVEGATDTLAAMDMAYIAVGKPSAEADNTSLANLVKNRDVIVIGENDEAGQRGMEATFQTLKSKCKSVIKILPPDRFKDLREWYPTADEFEAWVRKNKVTRTADGTFETIHYPPLAQEFLKKLPRLVCFEGDWFNLE